MEYQDTQMSYLVPEWCACLGKFLWKKNPVYLASGRLKMNASYRTSVTGLA